MDIQKYLQTTAFLDCSSNLNVFLWMELLTMKDLSKYSWKIQENRSHLMVLL